MSLSAHEPAPPLEAPRFPVALRMARVVSLVAWVGFVAWQVPGSAAYALGTCIYMLRLLGSAVVALALVATLLDRRTPFSEPRWLSVAWYVFAIGWTVPGTLHLGSPVIPVLLAAELLVRSRRRGALGG